MHPRLLKNDRYSHNLDIDTWHLNHEQLADQALAFHYWFYDMLGTTTQTQTQ